ncbi:ATP-binding cassette domain-containing protein [Salinimicrobium tongyeongense]|uniref:ATP-binding cassette domain-containing protein n=1 Tax=Salinimicrobium tongyeongense TaxID=2809707 RepID=UPI00223589D0|nr:ATP-binding cassette domain-containing protein [Salinimicrobium tongyeongense]
MGSDRLDMMSLQERIGYITQDPVIFGDTLFNNVTFWAEDNEKNRQKFWKAIEQAAILDFVHELPAKEETILGNNGVNLSGGQRQRISIARELFKQVEILILDEATSALDSETERAIQTNIEKLKGSYTMLIVAHRIATIKNADKIVVMKNGEIADIGEFKDLVAHSSYFGKLVALQEI